MGISVPFFDFNWSRSPKIRHPFALVCHCGLADIRRSISWSVASMSPCCVAPSSPYSRTLEQCNTASCDNHEIIKSCVCFSFLYEYGSPLDSPAPLTQMQQSDWLSYATKLVFHCVCIDSGISRKICVLVFVPTTLVLKWAAPKSGLLLCFFFLWDGGRV